MKKKLVWIFALLMILVMSVLFINKSITSELSLDDVNAIIKSKGIDNITWNDFEEYPHQDVGSGNYVYRYELSNGSYLYLSGPDLDISPTYIYIIDENQNRTDLKK